MTPSPTLRFDLDFRNSHHDQQQSRTVQDGFLFPPHHMYPKAFIVSAMAYGLELHRIWELQRALPSLEAALRPRAWHLHLP